MAQPNVAPTIPMCTPQYTTPPTTTPHHPPPPTYRCREVYDRVSPGFRGRCTAPLLVDKQARTIVSNESSDIVRMLNDMHLPG